MNKFHDNSLLAFMSYVVPVLFITNISQYAVLFCCARIAQSYKHTTQEGMVWHGFKVGKKLLLLWICWAALLLLTLSCELSFKFQVYSFDILFLFDLYSLCCASPCDCDELDNTLHTLGLRQKLIKVWLIFSLTLLAPSLSSPFISSMIGFINSLVRVFTLSVWCDWNCFACKWVFELRHFSDIQRCEIQREDSTWRSDDSHDDCRLHDED